MVGRPIALDAGGAGGAGDYVEEQFGGAEARELLGLRQFGAEHQAARYDGLAGPGLDVGEVFEGGFEAAAEGRGLAAAVAAGEHVEGGAVMAFESLDGEQADGVGVEVRREVADAQAVAGGRGGRIA